MTTAQKLHGGLLAVAAVVGLTAWGLGLLSGNLTSLDPTAAAILFLVELPFLTFWLVPGSATARLGVLFSTLLAVDAARVHLLTSSDTMVLADAWPWLVVMGGAWLINRAHRGVRRRAADRTPDYGAALHASRSS